MLYFVPFSVENLDDVEDPTPDALSSESGPVPDPTSLPDSDTEGSTASLDDDEPDDLK